MVSDDDFDGGGGGGGAPVVVAPTASASPPTPTPPEPRAYGTAGGGSAAKEDLPLSFSAGVDESSAKRLPRSGPAARLLGMVAGLPVVSHKLVSFAWDEFNVPHGEELRFDASCALKERHLLLQGRLYVFQSRVGFFSSVFGVVRKKSMLFADITAIKRTTRRSVLGSIEIICDGHKYEFASLWDAERALVALHEAWRASGSGYAKLYLDAQQQQQQQQQQREALQPQRSETVRPVEPPEVVQAPATPRREDATQPAADKGLTSEPSVHLEHLEGLMAAASKDEPEPLLSPPSPLVPASASAFLPDIMPASCAGAQPAPPPEGTALLPVAPDGAGTEIELDCTPSEFFALFLNDGSRFIEAFRSARGETEIDVAAWRDESGAGAAASCARTVTFRAPLDAMKGAFRLPGIPKSTRIKEEQRCSFHDCAAGEGEPQMVVLDSTSAQLDIPYGDAFLLDARLELRASSASPPRCTARVHFRVRWLHPPRLGAIRHKIENQSTSSTADAFRMMLGMAQSYLTRWEQLAAAMGPSPRRGGGAEKKGAAEGPAEEVVPLRRLEQVLATLEPAEAAHIRDALHLAAPEAAAEQGVEEAQKEDNESKAMEAEPEAEEPATPRGTADLLALLRQQSLVSSGPVAFGAVYDALQLTARAALAAPPAVRSWRKRVTRTLTLAPALALLALLLLCTALFQAGVRYGRRLALAATGAATTPACAA